MHTAYSSLSLDSPDEKKWNCSLSSIFYRSKNHCVPTYPCYRGLQCRRNQGSNRGSIAPYQQILVDIEKKTFSFGFRRPWMSTFPPDFQTFLRSCIWKCTVYRARGEVKNLELVPAAMMIRLGAMYGWWSSAH